MEATHLSRCEAFVRVKDFSATHTDIAGVPIYLQLEITLNEVFAELDKDAAASEGAALAARDLRGTARRTFSAKKTRK